MTDSLDNKNRRVLVIDDNRSIHEDFAKILAPAPNATPALRDTEMAVFGVPLATVSRTQFQVDSAYQGREGVVLIEQALAAGKPYAMAFVDVRMPPGWDGVETARRIWELDPNLQIVLCTAYSDYSWTEIFEKLRQRDRLLILKKPFDAVEAFQLAHALTEKWWLHQERRKEMDALESRVAARTRQLEQSNEALKRSEKAHQERARMAVLEAETSSSLSRGGTLPDMLRLCCEAIVRRLDAAFARIWTLNERDNMLELQASAGLYTHLDGPHGRLPVGQTKIGLIAQERKPHLTNNVPGDPRVGDQEWAIRQGLVAFAGYPLIVEDRLVGVLGTFARHEFTKPALQALASVSSNLAVGIERKRTEEQLRWKTALLEAQVHSLVDGILVIDENGNKCLHNQRFVDLFKIPQNLANDTNEWKRIQWGASKAKNPQEFLEKVLYLNANPREISHDEFELADGVILDRHSSPVVGKDGRYYGRIWAFRDITARKNFEARRFQSQRMEVVGKLAGGIAHEFNSILTAIIGQSELLLADLPHGSPLSKNATEISRAAARAAALTRQLLAYGRKQILQPEILDLNMVLANMQGMFHHIMGGEVSTQIVPGTSLRMVRVDAGQIEQVIMNIVINARQAMPNGGKLTLETANVSFEQESVGRNPEIKPGEYVMLAITDTGTGMSDEVKAHIFEPFYSTKEPGQGTGLGLSTCYGIVKQSGGHISVYSEVGRGATFKVYLPHVQSQSKAPAAPLGSRDLPRGTETVLLVEDDPALREMAGTLLRRLGYTVWVAANGIEALSLKQQRPTGHIDLLFTDVVMPHMSGKELADRMQALHPQTRILFTSAYTENAIVQQGALNKGVALLQKPFTPSALARKVREMLDTPGLPPPDILEPAIHVPSIQPGH